MALTSGALDAMLGGFTAVASHVSLHTDNPGTNGASEVEGGTYSRESSDWAAASGGTAVNDGPIVFDVPAATTIKFLGYWSAPTNGTFYGFRALDADQAYATAGTYTIAAGDLSESIS